MRKLLILMMTFIILLSINCTIYGAESTNLRVDFSVKDVSTGSEKSDFKEITVTPYRYENGEKIVDEVDDTYYIYLPTGYYTLAKSASYTVDKNGKYPFTVYFGNSKKTFFYTVNDIGSDDTSGDESDNKYNEIYINNKLQYDYEKKQLLFNIVTDKVRTIITPDNTTTISNEVNYYIKTLENNIPYDFSILIDDEKYDYRVIKQGEYYLLIAISPVNYDNYSTIATYSGYNFTNNNICTVFPQKDIYDDNGNYEVLVKSGSSQSIFNFNITNIDYRRPLVDAELLDDNTFDLQIKDDFNLDYIITFDGKYVPINDNTTEFNYHHNTIIDYDGDYIFTVVDKAGNRTVEPVKITTLRTPRKHKINYDVHDYKYTNDLFENKGLEYEESNAVLSSYENVLPAYMSGNNTSYFNPNLPITRAEMITIFCRINDLPYDTRAFLKNKFTDIDDHWARDYISMGSSKKYVAGYKDKTFRPNNYVTRAEFCEMLTKISSFKPKINDLPATNNYNFKDINNHWAEGEIIKISNRDLVTGYFNNFYPDKAITRGEVAHAINKLFGFNPSNNELNYINSLYNKYYSFNDIKNHKYYNDIIISVVGMYKENID